MKVSLNPKWRTDYDFYVNQQSYPQTMMIAGCDMHTTNLEKMPRSRERSQNKEKVKEKMTVLAFKQGLKVIQLHMHFGGGRQKVM